MSQELWMLGTSICSEAYDSIKGNVSCVDYSISTPPSIQLPVLLSVDTGVFRLQGFVLELETCQSSAFFFALHHGNYLKRPDCLCKSQRNIES